MRPSDRSLTRHSEETRPEGTTTQGFEQDCCGRQAQEERDQVTEPQLRPFHQPRHPRRARGQGTAQRIKQGASVFYTAPAWPTSPSPAPAADSTSTDCHGSITTLPTSCTLSRLGPRDANTTVPAGGWGQVSGTGGFHAVVRCLTGDGGRAGGCVGEFPLRQQEGQYGDDCKKGDQIPEDRGQRMLVRVDQQVLDPLRVLPGLRPDSPPKAQHHRSGRSCRAWPSASTYVGQLLLRSTRPVVDLEAAGRGPREHGRVVQRLHPRYVSTVAPSIQRASWLNAASCSSPSCSVSSGCPGAGCPRSCNGASDGWYGA